MPSEQAEADAQLGYLTARCGAQQQLELIDMIAERVQTLGGVAVRDPRLVAEITRVPRPPNGCE